jgi:hypothetical protein
MNCLLKNTFKMNYLKDPVNFGKPLEIRGNHTRVGTPLPLFEYRYIKRSLVLYIYNLFLKTFYIVLL